MLSPTRARGVPFGWLFIGYANLLYPAGVMGWLSNVCCPLLGLGCPLPEKSEERASESILLSTEDCECAVAHTEGGKIRGTCF